MTTKPLHIPPLDPDASILDAAFAYAAAGWYVLPIRQREKHAGSVLGAGWPAKSSRDPEWLAAWFAGSSDGLALHVGRSGAICFDVDAPLELPAALTSALVEHTPPFQSTRAAEPARGHYMFATPPGRMLGNSRGELRGSWGEVRGRNGIIVVQPTEHEKDGARYQWTRTGTLPGLPRHIADLLPDALNADDAATDSEVRAFIEQHGGSTRGQLLRAVTRRYTERIAAGESRHETAVGCVVQALKEARAGYYPARDAITQLRDLFTASINGERPAGAEFEGILSWATAQAQATNLDNVRAITERNITELKPIRLVPNATTETSGSAALAAEPEPEQHNSEASPAPARIDVTHEPDAITGLTRAIAGGAIPDTYVRAGQLVRIGEVSGAPGTTHIGPAIGIETIDSDGLRRLLAFHAETYRWKKVDGALQPVTCSPTTAALKSVLTERHWPTVDPLCGVIATPVLRPDGTLLQESGYDAPTGLYYDPTLSIPLIPEHPTPLDIAAALQLLLEHVLGDFPWASDADRANYIALLMAPILRPYIGGLTPLGAISATERGSGKTLLTTIIGQLYGATSRPWVSNDDELRKAITAVLFGTSPVVLFDNVGEHDSVSAPSLAKLLTSAQWDDRLLGTNSSTQAVNDRLWLVTGNSLEFGGDIAQRTVLVRLDPKCPRPDLRTGFRIPDLEAWLEIDANRAELLRALLVLTRSWMTSGAQREEFVMRGFGRWACAMGGFLSHHGIPGFLGNTAELEEHDEEASSWAAFLTSWHHRFGDRPVTAADLRKSANPDFGFDDPWSGTFITRGDGMSLPTAKGLGRMLARHRGRFYGALTLRGWQDTHDKVWRWTVTPYEREGAS